MHILKNVVVLGATGSIGDSTFKVLKNLGAGYRVIGLSGGAKSKKLVELSKLWRPRHVCVPSAEQAILVASELPGIEVEVGEEGLCIMATLAEADIIINGLVGAVGLKPTLAALAAGKVVAMANKEPLVMAGGLVLQAAKRGGGELLPLDSEPNAIWQCLKGEPREALARVILTASGGPFFGRQRAQMQAISPAEALAHPTWKMGPKITVDSATLMNKGFEAIEAAWLFGVDIDSVDVLVHRQSVVHSLVEFVDGSLLAHMGKTDMLLPIQYALTHPQRQPAPLGRLDLAAVGQLSFAEPDGENFPCLDLCYEAGRAGGTAPAVLNAANEIAVAAFLQGRIGFLDIGVLNSAMLAAHTVRPVDELATVLEADAATRQAARAWIEDRA
jgi:1-deoxy-D-xylulose-5-phosphate reductoisomerase